MDVTDRTRELLWQRRIARRLEHAGYEYVGEDGGKLWEIQRGPRSTHKITAVVVAPGGKGIYAKIEKDPEAIPLNKRAVIVGLCD